MDAFNQLEQEPRLLMMLPLSSPKLPHKSTNITEEEGNLCAKRKPSSQVLIKSLQQVYLDPVINATMIPIEQVLSTNFWHDIDCMTITHKGLGENPVPILHYITSDLMMRTFLTRDMYRVMFFKCQKAHLNIRTQVIRCQFVFCVHATSLEHGYVIAADCIVHKNRRSYTIGALNVIGIIKEDQLLYQGVDVLSSSYALSSGSSISSSITS
jgi:hypothetical protein